MKQRKYYFIWCFVVYGTGRVCYNPFFYVFVFKGREKELKCILRRNAYRKHLGTPTQPMSNSVLSHYLEFEENNVLFSRTLYMCVCLYVCLYMQTYQLSLSIFRNRKYTQTRTNAHKDTCSDIHIHWNVDIHMCVYVF